MLKITFLTSFLKELKDDNLLIKRIRLFDVFGSVLSGKDFSFFFNRAFKIYCFDLFSLLKGRI